MRWPSRKPDPLDELADACEQIVAVGDRQMIEEDAREYVEFEDGGGRGAPPG